MKYKLLHYKENWLLKWGAISFLLLLICSTYLLFSFSEASTIIASERGAKFISFVFMATLIGPVIEEISFRGIFLKNKFWIFLGFVLMGRYALKLGNLLFVIFYCVYIFLFLIWYLGYQENIFYKRFIYIANALLFSLGHIPEGSSLLSIALQITSGFTTAFICIWLVINFNLFKAILFHVFWNLIALSFFLIELQYPDKTISTIENQAIKIEWQKNKIYPFERDYKILNDSTRVYKNYLLKDLIINHNDKYEQRDLNRPYNLTIYVKDSLLYHDIDLYSEEVYKLLIEEKLLILDSE